MEEVENHRSFAAFDCIGACPHCAFAVLLTSLLALATAQAAVQYEDCVKHYYGSKSRPHIEIEIEESEGSPPFLTLHVLESSGVATRAASQLPKPANSRKIKAGSEIAGINRLQGREFRYRANLSRDWSTLEVLEPKSILLADGSKVVLDGRYAELSEQTRAAAAKAAFDAADEKLNDLYSQLTATLDPAARENLRTDQRRWLNYRDFAVYSGDNASIIGPGTAPHFRQQARRTVERIEFLKSLLAKPQQAETANALYSDGRGGTAAVRRVDDAVFVAATVCHPSLNSVGAPGDTSCVLSVVARPDGENTWAAKPKDMAVTEGSWKAELLRLVFDPAGVLRIEAAGEHAPGGLLAQIVGGSYHWLRPLAPAEEPLRSLLLQLPEAAFEETTEGLSSDEKKSLALTGTGGTFTIEEETQDYMVLRHHDGTVKLLRLKAADGAAVVAAEQTNGRNLVFQVWRKAPADDAFKLWENALPKPPVEEYFVEDLGGDVEKIKGQSKHVFHFDKGQSLNVTLDVRMETPQPDYYHVLEWDGFGFAVERIKD